MTAKEIIKHQWTGAVKLVYPVFYVCECGQYYHLKEFREHLKTNNIVNLLHFDIMRVYYNIKDKMGV